MLFDIFGRRREKPLGRKLVGTLKIFLLARGKIYFSNKKIIDLAKLQGDLRKCNSPILMKLEHWKTIDAYFFILAIVRV